MKQLQPALFNLSSPPVKPAKVLPALDEPAFYEALFEHPPSRVHQCTQCKGAYFSISYHLLYNCSAEVHPAPQTLTPPTVPGGRMEAPKVEASPLPLIDTPAKDPPETMPGVYERDNDSNKLSEHYPYKSKGMPDAEKMHPSQWVAPQPPAPTEEPAKRPPHWWHWVRPSTPKQVTGADGKSYEVQSKAQEPYTPHLVVRRRSIPSIGCALYYQAWSLYATKQAADNAGPGYVKANAVFYKADKAKVDKLIALLVFCDVPLELAKGLALEAWQDAEEEVFKAWSDKGEKKGIGREMLLLIGYELAEGEPDGHMDSHITSYAHVAEQEGVKGR